MAASRSAAFVNNLLDDLREAVACAIRSRALSTIAGNGKNALVDAWFLYIVECRDRTLYVGVARNVARRIEAHDAGRGARYTRGRGPLRLLVTRRCGTHGEALRLEAALKRLEREQKLALARSRRSLARFAAKLGLGR